MNLYLSSYRTGKQEALLVEMVGEGGVITIIPNAKDFIDNKKIVEGTGKTAYETSLAKDIDKLKSLGFRVEILDLKEYFGKEEDLRERMSSVKSVYVPGGNAFLLREALEKSGFGKVLDSRKSDPEFVYAGYSAGVCVLGPSLKGLELVDPIDIHVDGYDDKIIWEGLGIIDFSIAPHFDSPGHPETHLIPALIEYFKKNNIEYMALRDGEVLTIDNSGKETFYSLEGIKTGPEK